MKTIIRISLSLVWLSSISVGQDISAVKLKDVDGKPYAIGEHLAHDANIVLFWATWCLPCQKEFPEIQQLLETYPDQNINVFAISKDSPRSVAKVKAFIRKNNYNFIWLLDTDGSASSNLMVDAIPHSFIADSTGTIVYSHTGYRKGDEQYMEKELLKLWQK